MTLRLPEPRLILLAVAMLAVLAVFALAPTPVPLNGVAHAQTADPPADPEPTIVNICDRTPQVRDAILAKLPDVSDCATVTDLDLAGIRIIDLSDTGITELKAGDFLRLTKLEYLYLDNNNLSALPDRIFDGLANLQTLWVKSNRLSTVPDGVFDELPNLKFLYLGGNSLSALPDGVFANLANLQHLHLNDNNLTGLPDGVFDELPNLLVLDLYGNKLSGLPDDVFANLANLQHLHLHANELSGLPEGVFEGLANLEWLLLNGNDLGELPEGVFDGLANLEWLALYGNKLSALPEGAFEGLSVLERLELQDNPGADFTFRAELEQQGENAVVAKVAQGAPFAIAVVLSAQGGKLSSASVTVEAGSLTSAPVTVAPDGHEPVAVSVVSASFHNYDEYAGIQTGLGEPLVLGDTLPVNTPATGAPTISGTAQVGETLTVDTSGVADEDGVSGATFSYQWLSNDGASDTEIEGATGVTYTLRSDDEGKTVKVRVTFTDDANHEETLTSAPTATVAPTPIAPPTAAPTITSVTPGGGSLTIGWTAPAENGGKDITAYDLRYIEGVRGEGDANESWTLEGSVWTSGDLQYTITGLANETPYRVQVRALNADGASPWSDYVYGLPDAHGDTLETATEVEVGVWVSGRLVARFPGFAPVLYDDVDFFKFVLTDFTEVQLWTSGDVDFWGYTVTGFTLLDSTGAWIPGNGVEYGLEAGIYYVRVEIIEYAISEPYGLMVRENTSYTDFLTRCSAIETEFDDPLYGCQWDLKNTEHNHGTPGEDINVEPVWADNILGEGITVAIVDDGMDYTHEDLRDNVDTSRNYDYTGNGDILTPTESHGTKTAGVIAGRDNGLGIRGVAPRATIYGYNAILIDDSRVRNSVVTHAMLQNHVHTAVSNNSWGYPTNSGSRHVATNAWHQAVETGVTEGFHGKGTFYVFGAGNAHTTGSHANFSEYKNSYAVTTVCEVDSDGRVSIHSERGDNLWVCAPGAWHTTDNYSRYANNFGGTSAATAVVSGVAALVRSANPDLTWRDVKLILAASARKNQLGTIYSVLAKYWDSPWETGALKYGSDTERYSYNSVSGFGVVDAKAAVDLAKAWTNLPPLQEATGESGILNATIPERGDGASPQTYTHSLTLGTGIKFTEFIQVRLNMRYEFLRDLEIELVSPSGAVSKLSVPHLYVLSGFPTDGALSFGSARHLGENPNGKWTLRVTDHISASTRLAGTSGWSQAQVDGLKRKLAEPQYLVEWSITAYGHVGAPILGAPGITGVTSGDGSLTVAWEAPDDTGGAAVTAYDLRYIRSDAPDKADAFWTVQEGVWASGALQYTLTGLTKGAGYEVQVRAVTANGGLPWSHAGVGTYRTVPGAPTIESLSAGDRSLVVSWSAPADNGGADNVRYDVSRTLVGYLSSVDGKPHWAFERDIWASGDLQYTLSSYLRNGREYGVRVRAVNAAGEGPWSTVARGIPSTIPDAPSIWRVVTPGDGSLTVQWYAPADSGGAAIIGYDLRYIRSDAADKADDDWAVEQGVWASGDLRYTLSGLTNGTEYDVQMRAVTADGDLSWSDTSVGTPGTAPGTPTIESLSSGGDRSVIVRWSPPADDGHDISSYDLGWGRTDGYRTFVVEPRICWASRCRLPSGELEYTLSGLTNGTEYDVRVRAVNAAGDGPWSTTVRTATQQAPTAATVTEVTPGDGSLTVKWDAPADSGGAAVTGYDLRYIRSDAIDRRDELRTVEEGVWTSGELEFTLTGLGNGVRYDVQVRAVTADGDLPWSYTGVGTPRATPSAPTIEWLSSGDGSLTVKWDAPAEKGGTAIIGYDLRYIRSDAADKADADWAVEQGVWASGELEYTLSGLTNGTEYDVQVRAVNAAGDGPWSATGTATPQESAPTPTVTIELSPSGSVEEGTEIALTMSFSNLPSDPDVNDPDVNLFFRADVVDADQCENQDNGYGIGVTRYMDKVDEDPEIRDGTISAACPAGDYTIEVSVSSPDNVELASATANFSVVAPAPEPALSTDATLSSLTLSDVTLAFASTTTEYTASVANDVDETTVTPTTNHGGAAHAIKLDGVADADGVVPLAVGSNVITIEVTAEDGNASQTYTITVTRAAPPAPGPAVTVELSPSGPVEEGTEVTVTMSFANLESDSDTSDTDYIFRADVVNADGCEGGGMGLDRYMYKVDEDPEVRAGTISTSCAPGDYTVEVSISSPSNIELASASANFSVVAPAPEPALSTDATLSSLTLSDVTLAFASTTTEYTASVANDVDETTVTPTTNHGGAAHAIKLDGVADADGVVPLAVGSNIITIEVTAEDGETTKTYTVTVTRAAPPLSADATLSGLTLSGIDIGAFDSSTTGYTASVANDVAETTVTPTLSDDGASYAIKLGGVADDDGTVSLAVGSNVITIEVTAEDGQTTKTYTVTVTRAAAPAPEPTVAIELSSDSVEEGTEITVTMSFANLTPDHDTNLVFRADVVGADGCEGQGIGVARNISKVDEDPEIRTGTISGNCTAGDYTLEVSLTGDDVELASARADFAVVEPEPTDEPKPTSPPGVPDKPTGEVTGKGQVRLDWNDVEGATYYQVRFYDNADWVELPTAEMSLVLDGSGATASNLPDYGFYYFAVRAGNAAGVSEWSDFLTLPNPEQ